MKFAYIDPILKFFIQKSGLVKAMNVDLHIWLMKFNIYIKCNPTNWGFSYTQFQKWNGNYAFWPILTSNPFLWHTSAHATQKIHFVLYLKLCCFPIMQRIIGTDLYVNGCFTSYWHVLFRCTVHLFINKPLFPVDLPVIYPQIRITFSRCSDSIVTWLLERPCFHPSFQIK